MTVSGRQFTISSGYKFSSVATRLTCVKLSCSYVKVKAVIVNNKAVVSNKLIILFFILAQSFLFL
jgi:hypothetical protein